MKKKRRGRSTPMSGFFAYISRMKYITRWALMRNSVTENIQEHSQIGRAHV